MPRGFFGWLFAAALSISLTSLAADPSPPASKTPPPAADQPGGGTPANNSPAKDSSANSQDDSLDNLTPDQKADAEYYDLYKALADTIDQVERNYVKPIDRRELMEAAIKGIMSKLDPYSAYISPDEFTNFRSTVESQFGGIGIQITMDDGQLKVISPLVGTPAYRAGIQAGDKILKIDGQPTDNITLEEATKRLKGDVGANVALTVEHFNSTKPETFTLKRELVHVDTVLGASRKPDDSWDFMLDPESRIGYIRVTSFSRDTPADLRKALDDLKARKMRALILDLRFDPGGLLGSAVEVSNLFISEGRIVSTKGRNTKERVWDAVNIGAFEGFPMVVLVNHYSASASEIVAACLQDHHRAAIAGDRTWGKGSVQNVIELESGHSALKLTTSGYTRPNGHKIHRFPDDKDTDEWGVTPDKGLEVKLTNPEMAMLLVDRRERDVVEGKHETEKSQTPAAEKTAAQNTGSSKSDAAKSDASKNSDAKLAAQHGKKLSADRSSAFVDRQLQKAVEYLNSELARAQ